MIIIAEYRASDGYSLMRKYKTKVGFLQFLEHWVGTYERDGLKGEGLAAAGTRVSFDGVGVVDWHTIGG